MADEREVRHLEGLRAETTGATPRLIGTAIVFNERSQDLGGFIEVIAPGAVQYDDHALVALHNHDTSRVLGRSPRTLVVTTDTRGLHFELDPPKSAADLVESVQRGDATGVSFAFSHAKDSWDMTATPPLRTIHSMRVHEISLATTFPAYAGPHVAVALRSLESARAAAPSPLEVPVPEPIAPVVDPQPIVPPVVTRHEPEDLEYTTAILTPQD